MGSKWAHSTCLCTPNSPKVSLQKHIFDPFLTDLWSLFMHPKWSRIIFGKTLFWSILTHFLVAKQPIFKAFCDFGGAQLTCNGLKMGSFHVFRHPKWSRIIFGKTLFLPIFDPFLVAKQPIFKAFWYFRRAKTGHHELKTRQKHLFWHSMWCKIIFEKSLFLHPVDLVDPFWHPPLWATSCRLPQPTRPRYGGLGTG